MRNTSWNPFECKFPLLFEDDCGSWVGQSLWRKSQPGWWVGEMSWLLFSKRREPLLHNGDLRGCKTKFLKAIMTEKCDANVCENALRETFCKNAPVVEWLIMSLVHDYIIFAFFYSRGCNFWLEVVKLINKFTQICLGYEFYTNIKHIQATNLCHYFN